MLGSKLNQCNNNVKNSTIMCVKWVCNWAAMDEKFVASIEYVEHRLLMKAIMGLEATWKDKKVQKIQEYINKKRVGFEAFVPLTWSKLFGDGILCTTFSLLFQFYKKICHHSH
jgi:hypothetical protein